MRIIFLISFLFSSAGAAVVDVTPFRICLEKIRKLDEHYRNRIPSVLFHLDRNLVRISQRIPYLEESLEVLSLRATDRPEDKYNTHLIGNSTDSCQTLAASFEQRANSLFLFLASMGVTVLVILVTLAVRPIIVSLLSTSVETKPTPAVSPPEDKPVARKKRGSSR